MLNFKKEQQTIDIGGIKIGGQIGKYPTVLIGSIFYEGDKIVSDENKGIFDRKKAEELIFLQKELSDKSGNPCMLDLVGTSEAAFRNYIDFVANLTSEPFLLNATSAELRIKLIKYIKEIGLTDRIIYNSINYTFLEEEINAIKKYNIKSALIQSLNPTNSRIIGMLELLKGKDDKEGLVEKSLRAGLKNLLLFTNIFEIPTIGLASRGIYRLKEEFGLPTGTAPVGVIGKWCIKNNVFKGNFKGACESAGVALAQATGADYIIYGALKKAEHIFPAAAIIDAMISLNSRITFGLRTIDKNHPINKLYFPLT